MGWARLAFPKTESILAPRIPKILALLTERTQPSAPCHASLRMGLHPERELAPIAHPSADAADKPTHAPVAPTHARVHVVAQRRASLNQQQARIKMFAVDGAMACCEFKRRA